MILKRRIKQFLINRQHKEYEKRVLDQNLSYDKWISQQEKNVEIENFHVEKNGNFLTNDFKTTVNGGKKIKNERNNSKNVILCRPFEFFDLSASDDIAITLISVYEGEISKIAINLICRQFLTDKNTILVYGDEDIKENNVRENPWFKPDWSPDRFLSCFYFSHCCR